MSLNINVKYMNILWKFQKYFFKPCLWNKNMIFVVFEKEVAIYNKSEIFLIHWWKSITL